MRIVAVDPGTTQSACVQWDGARILNAEILPNEEVLAALEATSGVDVLVIEWITGYGKPVGSETFETCRWVGRFQQAFQGRVVLLPRREVKRHLCETTTAKDPHVWQALKARFGEPGKKKAPGLLYGITSHLQAAFAVAVTWWDQNVH
jgi:hypothetical protein